MKSEEPLVGVNIGGWLVLEKWMTPSVFDGTDAEDEYTFMQTPEASAKIDRHRASFITEADFAWLASHGVTAVRIPVGYWILDDDGPYESGAGYLDWAFDIAQKYSIAVLLDIHALPGSQNGNDHSGKIGKALWQKDRRFRAQSLDSVRAFAERYGNHPALWGIEIINEPNAGALQLPLRQYYSRAYRVLEKLLPPGVRIVYSDAWSPRIFAFALFGRGRAVMDVHLYHMATLGAKTHSMAWYYKRLTRRIRTLGLLSRLRPMIIGEWSGVISGEVMKTYTPESATAAEKSHFEYQQKAYRSFVGTFYWNYKTENTRGTSYWDYRSIVDNDR